MVNRTAHAREAVEKVADESLAAKGDFRGELIFAGVLDC
jgi:hypothetical protein